MGVAARYVVVRLARVETSADRRFECQDSGGRGCRQPSSHLLAGLGQCVERGERIAEHRPAVERARGLIQGPERFGTVGIELKEIRGVWLREERGRYPRVIERPEQRERVQSRRFETGAQVRRDRRR